METMPWSTKIYGHVIGFILPAVVLVLIVDKYFLESGGFNFDIWRYLAAMVILGLLLETAFIQSLFNNFPGIGTREYRLVTTKIRESYQRPLAEAWALFENDAVKDPVNYQVITWRESMYNFFRNMAVFFLLGFIVSLVIGFSGVTILFLVAFLYCLIEARRKQKQLALILAKSLSHERA